MNLPANVRAIVYVLSTFINATVAILVSNQFKIPLIYLAILGGFNAVVALLAAKNVTPDRV